MATVSAMTNQVLLVGDPVNGFRVYEIDGEHDPRIEQAFANETFWVVDVLPINSEPGWHRREAARRMQQERKRP